MSVHGVPNIYLNYKMSFDLRTAKNYLYKKFSDVNLIYSYIFRTRNAQCLVEVHSETNEDARKDVLPNGLRRIH